MDYVFIDYSIYVRYIASFMQVCLLISLYFMDGLYDYVNIYILLTYKTLFLCIKQGPAENQFSVEQVTLLKYCEINK